MKDNDSTYPVGYSKHVINLFSSRSIHNQASFVLPYLKANMSLLDCGCGPGSITIGFAEKVFPGKVIGVDIQAEQLEYAKRISAEKKISNVEFQQANALSLPFADNSFDVIYANALLCHIKDPMNVIKEFKRVLKPNGFVASREMDWGAILIYPENPLLMEALNLREKALSILGCDYRIGRKLRELFLNAGFNKVNGSASCEYIPNDDIYKDIPEYMAQQWETAPFAQIVLEQKWTTKARIKEYQNALREFPNVPGAFRCWTWCEALAFMNELK